MIFVYASMIIVGLYIAFGERKDYDFGANVVGFVLFGLLLTFFGNMIVGAAWRSTTSHFDAADNKIVLDVVNGEGVYEFTSNGKKFSIPVKGTEVKSGPIAGLTTTDLTDADNLWTLFPTDEKNYSRTITLPLDSVRSTL